MAYDKLVDSTKLNAALTSTANSIRAKKGNTDAVIFDLDGGTGFSQTIDTIESNSVPDGSSITFGNQNGAPVEREEAYAISSEDLNSLGAITQAMSGKKSLMSVSDMIYWLNKVTYIPTTNIDTEIQAPIVDGNIIGEIPIVPIGSVTSIFSIENTLTSGVVEMEVTE